VRTGPSGSLFELRIPRATCPEDVPAVDGRVIWDGSVAPAKGIKVNCLIVDDEPEIREILRDLLETQIDGHVYEAAHGVEALDFLSTNQGRSVRLVLTDLTMPRMGGKQLVSEIRGRLGTIAPKIYIVTGRVPEAGGDPLIDSGADGYLQKPFGAEAIQKMLTDFATF
ncbi:MAG: response regulator, partial [Bdellovibrionales bacterium]|nr:response regulator [Bdellovibrionales bacterium]